MIRTLTTFSRMFLAACLVGLSFAVTTPAPAQAAAKRIIVDLSDQRLYAYSGNTLVLSAPVNARGTRLGTFRIQNKVATARSIVRGWQLPNWLGIYYVGRIQNGIHGPALTRNGSVATTSLGCVVLRNSADAARLFRWAAVGTPVTVRR